MVLSHISFVLFGAVGAVSMGGQVCHKTITKYTPDEFVDDIICSNRFYKQMLFKKVSTLVRRNLGLDNLGFGNLEISENFP